MPDSINQMLARMGTPRLLAALVGLGTIAAVWGFARWGMTPEMVPVSAGLPIERIGEATQRLEESGIAYALDKGGTQISVAAADAAQARVLLAAEGLAGSADRPGFELFDQPAWGMTDFTQRVNYRRALEGELERTIGRMRTVEAAQVHLALQESSFLQGEEGSSEASVVLRLRSGSRAEDSVVEGIQFLVANAVEGMSPDHVSVLDDRGRLLSNPEGDSGVGLTSRQLQVRSQIERHLESKAEVLVTRMVGPGNASVRVSAELDFDQIDRTVESINADQQVVVQEDKSEIIPGSEEQGAGSVSTNTTFETPRSVETVSRDGARLTRLTVAVVLADKRVEADDGTVTFEARTPAEIQAVRDVVANAVGISAARGDAISVVSVPYAPEPAVEVPEEGPDVIALAMAFQKPVVALVGFIIALLLGTRVLGTIRTLTPPRPAAVPPAPVAGAMPALEPPEPAPQAVLGTVASQAPMVSDPNMTARVVRAWLNEGA